MLNCVIVDSIFHRFISSEVSSFVTVFKEHVSHVISGSILSSLFGDVICLCDSLSMIHCNMLFLLQPVMLDSVVELMSKYWELVGKEWSNQLNSSLFWMKTIYSSNVYRLKSADAFILFRSEQNEKENESMDLLPSYLLDVPILAKLVNDLIGTMNELRFVALRGCGKQICASLEEQLKGMAQSIVDSQEVVKQVRNEKQFDR